MRVAVFQQDEEKKAMDDSILELRQMQKYLNSIDEILQEEVPVNKKAKTPMHELCRLVCSTSLDDTAAASLREPALLQVYNWIASFLRQHSHRTIYQNQQSDLVEISASIVQGSSIGPALYV